MVGPQPASPAAVVLVAILSVRVEAAAAFRDYERRAAAVMAAHGGRVERTVVVPSEDREPRTFREVHLVRFPAPEALAAYRADPALQALAALRGQVIEHSEVLVGEEGPDYSAPSPG
jgi:uncharacterized protein (DUF1330 family)